MKIALVTTPWSAKSGIGDYTRHLLPYLREGADVDLFVEVGREGEGSAAEALQSVAELQPREYDQILYQLGNEIQHAFMVPMVRSLGGTVVLHDWVLFDLALATYPELQKGGLRGLRRAYQEGGLEQVATWRRARRAAKPPTDGWFPIEEEGRWSTPLGPLPGECTGLRLSLHVPKGRSWQLVQAGAALAESDALGEEVLEVKLDPSGPAPCLQVQGCGARGADRRQLGVFLRSLKQERDGAWHPVDLTSLSPVPERGLCAARFELSLNHSIVRHADAFLVHADVIGERILESRNAPTPIARVHHGAEPRWLDGSREASRADLGLPDEWRSSFLLATFGALQAHKRPGVLLDALANLRRQGLDVRLLCIGDERPAEFDLQTAVAERDLSACVHVTGWLPEQDAWRAMHASNLCVNLRGPSTGGTSGGACQALSVGRGVIVSDLPELSHLPDDCVLRVAGGDGEVERLTDEIAHLCRTPERCAELEAAARAAVEDTLHWRSAARRYLEVLESYPRARASRRSLFIRFLHATAK